MTKKLYYTDGHLFDFTAQVLRCDENKGRWEIVLDETAFFPEGGGQAADRGTLGDVKVLDVHERDGEVVHYCDGPLSVGTSVAGQVDRELRLCRMQNHSGEHIFSGTAHRPGGACRTGLSQQEGTDGRSADRYDSGRGLLRLLRAACEPDRRGGCDQGDEH